MLLYRNSLQIRTIISDSHINATIICNEPLRKRDRVLF